MKVRRTAAAVGIISLSFFAMSALAYRFDFGALVEDASGREDKVSFGTGKDFSVPRTEVMVPGAYGRLVAVTAAADGKATLWFESQGGYIRNVAVDPTNPIVIERKGELSN